MWFPSSALEQSEQYRRFEPQDSSVSDNAYFDVRFIRVPVWIDAAYPESTSCYHTSSYFFCHLLELLVFELSSQYVGIQVPFSGRHSTVARGPTVWTFTSKSPQLYATKENTVMDMACSHHPPVVQFLNCDYAVGIKFCRSHQHTYR